MEWCSRAVARVRNKGRDAWTLLRPAGGSLEGLRPPIVAWHAEPLDRPRRESKRRLCQRPELPPAARSAQVDGLSTDQLIELKSGDEVELERDLGRPAFGESGLYAVWLEYHLTPGDGWDHPPATENDPDAMAVLTKARPVFLASNVLTVQVGG